MSTVSTIVLEADDVATARAFAEALGVADLVEFRPPSAESTGFRGFTLSLVCSQPANVDAIVDAAVGAGATVLKPAGRSFWGYGGVVRSPDGVIWKVAASSKKDKAPGSATFDELVLLLGVDDVKASKVYYADQGLPIGKSFGGKYAELVVAPVKIALYPRKAAAKDAGVPEEGSGSHRIAVRGDLGGLTDPDGFVWEARTA